MERLGIGTTIRVTQRDDAGSRWGLDKAIDVEWNGSTMRGCVRGLAERGLYWRFTRRELKEAISGGIHCNIDGMIEQLIAEGLLA
jgi:hypothetical protein